MRTLSLTAFIVFVGQGMWTPASTQVPLPGDPAVMWFTTDCTGLTCSFIASVDPDGAIASYRWDFGDARTGAGAAVSRTYATEGTYAVTLTVTDNAGATSTQTRNVTVVPQTVVTRIAYHQCWADAINWVEVCDIHTLVDGYDTVVAGGVDPVWSPDGSKIAFTSGVYDTPDDIFVKNLADGSVTNVTRHPARVWGPSWSRDGGKIAFVSDRDGPFELYVMDADGANVTRLTYDAGLSGPFGWSPDGGRIAFVSSRDGATDLYLMDAGGSNPMRLTNNMEFSGQAVWSPDGGRIAFRCGNDICTINTDGTNFVRLPSDPLEDPNRPYGLDPAIAVMESGGAVSRVARGLSDAMPAWSPDGSRLAFVGDAPSWYSGRCCPPDGGACNADDFCRAMYDIYVSNADGTGLTAIASGGNPDWFIPLPGRPIAAFTSDCQGRACAFDASASFDLDGAITSYVWEFGDGDVGSGATAGHTYTRGGSFAVMLTVTDDAGATALVRRDVYANAPPVALFTVVCVGPTCTFDASGSSDPDGEITSYFWNFGDTHNGYGPTPTHVYATGTFSATLFVVDDAGGRGIRSQSVTVANAVPVVSFTRTCAGLTCTFDGSATSDADGTILHRLWRFGDGDTRYGVAAVTHAYRVAGTYTVSLEAVDNAGQSVTRTETVIVGNSPPVASFTSACSLLTCSFNASGSSDADGSIASYAWNFGDGTTGSGATAGRTYVMGGAHSVTLVVTDNSGATSTQTRTVTVAPARVGPRIAYDQCWADHGNWQTQCDTHVLVDGSETLLVSWQVGPKWSPDGSKIAFGGGEISVVNLADGSLVYLASHPARDWAQAWSPDGRIAFVSDRDGSVELYVMEADGSNLTRLTYNAGFTGAFRWSPDGSRIAFSSDRDGVRELYVMAADGSNPTRVTDNVGFNGQIAWSSRQPPGLRSAARWRAATRTSAASTLMAPTSSG